MIDLKKKPDVAFERGKRRRRVSYYIITKLKEGKDYLKN